MISKTTLYTHAPLLCRFLRVVGALFLCTGLIVGTLIAHLPLYDFAPKGHVIAQRAMHIQMFHGLALIICGLLQKHQTRIIFIGEFALLIGTSFFCTAVYLRAFWDIHAGHLAPTGGCLMIIAWFVLAVGWGLEKPHHKTRP